MMMLIMSCVELLNLLDSIASQLVRVKKESIFYTVHLA